MTLGAKECMRLGIVTEHHLTRLARLGLQHEGVPPLTPRQRDAFMRLLQSMANHSAARWDQHLRYDIGDQDANVIMDFVRHHFMGKD